MTVTTAPATIRQIGTIAVRWQPTTWSQYSYYYVEIITPRLGLQRIKGDATDPATAAQHLIKWVNCYRYCQSRYEEEPVALGDKIASEDLPEGVVAAWKMAVPV
jgi:hypothetical protein